MVALWEMSLYLILKTPSFCVGTLAEVLNKKPQIK